MDNVKDRVIDMLPKVVETKVTGEASILQLFDIHLKAKQTKKVAGCRVTNGMIEKGKFARLVRDGKTIHDGRLFKVYVSRTNGDQRFQVTSTPCGSSRRMSLKLEEALNVASALVSHSVTCAKET
jgi:translation initiation factor IF-2